MPKKDGGIMEKEPAAEKAVSKRRCYWSPFNERLIIVTGVTSDPDNQTKAIQFEEFRYETSDPDEIRRLDASPRKGEFFYAVENGAGNEAERESLMRLLRGMIEPDRFGTDQVKDESGKLALMALFTGDELKKLGVSRANPDVDRLIRAAMDNKKVEGV